AAELPVELRFDHLVASGDRWREGAKDRKRARERFQQAHNAIFDRAEPLERLLGLHEEDGNIEQVIDIRRHLLGLERDASVRARQWFALGEFCMFEARREKDAFEAFEEALDADPTMLEALEVLATALAEVQEWGELERVYEKMVTRFEKRDRDDATVTVLAELHRRMALLHRDHLEDSESALEELDKELALRPDQLSGQLLAAEVAVEVGDPLRAMRYLRRSARLDPTRSETFHQLFVAARRADDTESAFLAAGVAVEMGAADDRERIVYQEHRPQTPPPHSHQLSEEAWEWLRDPTRDQRVERIMHAIAPAVLRHRVKQLDAAGALPRLPDTGPQDPSTTTVSALRSIAWASQYLGITCPDLYAGEELPGGFTAPFAWKPTTFVGREVLTGKTLLELAFLAGRHLALRIPEHELIAHLTSIDELTACFLAGVHLVLGSSPSAGKLGKPVAALAKLLERQLEEAELEELHDAVEDFSEAGGRADLKRWIASVELCAARAGYLLCGDLTTSLRVLQEQPPNFATADRITHDLYAFAVSEEHLSLRHQLGSALDLPEDQAINS
ncbi:MAG TPA: hypothetical protein VFB62_24905, partial [Polyangiaceae bacterium]|nr:hypothetical protein [Polyangiaceae bacterium]